MAVLKVKKKKVSIVQNATRIFPALEDLEVTPSREEQNFKSTKYGYNNVKVSAIESDALEVHPGAENQEFNGMYHNVKVSGDSDLTPQNIRDGVDIFGVKGTGQILDLEINDCKYLFYQNTRVFEMEKILKVCKNVSDVSNMFYSNSRVTSLDLSNFVTTPIKYLTQVFRGASNLTDLNVKEWNTSAVESVNHLFYGCYKLKNLEIDWVLPKLKTMSYTFYNCYSLEELDLSNWDTSAVVDTSYAFFGTAFKRLIINRSDQVFAMINIGMFENSSIAKGTGYVYVPDNMVEVYKSATNWSTYASQIKGISELPPKEE